MPRETLFACKQFVVKNIPGVMKVGTDSMLLGSWARVDGAQTILDVGTGCGILALMLAQKNNTAAIDAIDVNALAVELAKANFASSRWHNNLHAHLTPLQDFHPGYGYDVIISNPPYFKGSLLGPGASRNTARHQLSLTNADLLHGTSRLLGESGSAYMAIPYGQQREFLSLLPQNGLHLQEVLEVRSREGLPPYLWLCKVSKTPQPPQTFHLTIYKNASAYSDAFVALTSPYYANMPSLL